MGIRRIIQEDKLVFVDGTEQILVIQEIQIDDQVEMILTGNLRSDIVHDFQDEMIAMATVGIHIVLDFKELRYLSSTAQQALLTVQQKLDAFGKGSLVLRHMPVEIYQEFEKTGTAELLMIDD